MKWDRVTKKHMTKTIDGVVAKYEISEEMRKASAREGLKSSIWRNYFINVIPYHN